MAAIPCTLLVDDDDTTNFLNRRLFERMAVTDTVLVAGNGQQALDLLRTHCELPTTAPSCPNLILLDMKMPLMNGFEFLQAFAQRSPRTGPPAVVIMLTTSLNPDDVARMQNLPIGGYLTKPLTSEKITHILQEHFAHLASAAQG